LYPTEFYRTWVGFLPLHFWLKKKRKEKKRKEKIKMSKKNKKGNPVTEKRGRLKK